MPKEVTIDVKTKVDDSELKGLRSELEQVEGEIIKTKVDVDTSEAEAGVENVRKIIRKAVGNAEGNAVIGFNYHVEGDDKIYSSLAWAEKRAKKLDGESVNIKIQTDLSEVKHIDDAVKQIQKIDGKTPKIKPTVEDNAIDELDTVQKKADDVDGTSPKLKPTVDGDATDELDATQKKADDLEGKSPKIKPQVDSGEAIGALDAIQQKIEGMGALESGLAGILGGMGVEQLLGGGVETAINMDKAWRNWVGGLQEAGMGFDEAKAKADQFKGSINKLASEGTSTDSLFKNVAGLAINLNNQISDSTLQMTEKVVAGYEMLGGRTGATLYEMEKELKNFLSTGDLGLMEDTLSSLKDPAKWKGLLEGAKTVDERIKVMNDMLQEEGIMGALNIDAPSKSIDSLKALFEAAMTSIGMSIINLVKPIADFFISLDEMTNGASTSILSVVAVVGTLSVALLGIGGMALPAISTGLTAFTSGLGMLSSGLTATTAAGAGLRTSLGVLVTGQSLATVGNYGFLASLTATVTGETAATTATWGLTTSLRAMTVALLTNPVFWIAAVIMGVAAAVIYLKTQTDLLSSVTEKGARAMDSMNQRLELLQGQSEASTNKVNQLKEKVDSLTEGTHEYELAMKNYEDEKQKLEDIKKEIKEIESIKGSAKVESSEWDTLALKMDKVKQKAYEGTGVTPHVNTSSENIKAFQDSIGQSAYYRDLTEKSITSLSKLSATQKKTFNGQVLARYSTKMEEIGELEEKAFKLAEKEESLD